MEERRHHVGNVDITLCGGHVVHDAEVAHTETHPAIAYAQEVASQPWPPCKKNSAIMQRISAQRQNLLDKIFDGPFFLLVFCFNMIIVYIVFSKVFSIATIEFANVSRNFNSKFLENSI